MHIALVAPLISTIHDDLTPLGGAQMVVGDLAHGLMDRGHQVTLLAADGSYVRGAEMPSLGIDSDEMTPAKFSSPGPRTDTAAQTAAFTRVRQWLDSHRSGIRVVHGHAYDAPIFLSLRGLTMPVLHTLHLPPLDDEVIAAAREVQSTTAFVTVSKASERQWQDRGISMHEWIYPGLDLDGIPFRDEPGSYLLFAGRVTPEKGTHQAIDVAAALGLPLILAGDVYDREYFDRAIAPRVRQDDAYSHETLPLAGATYIGLRPRADLLLLMSHARAVLMPSTWDEPFGLVGIEAQATGTPVVAYRRGGLAEVVADGETGWLVQPDNPSEFRQRVSMVDRIDRNRCRERIEQQFSMRRMIERYIELYDRLGPGEE